MSGGSSTQTTGYRYYLGLHMGLCLGPVDAVTELRVADRVAWTGNVTDNDSVTIDAEELFGGEEREGGIRGTLDIMMGGPSQAPNSYLQSVQGTPQPGYRGLLSLVFRRGLVSANNPYIKPWATKVRRVLKGWHNDDAWYTAKAAITVTGGEIAMNPAHIIYEALTNPNWGMRSSISMIDDANFRAAADIFYGEGLGLCMVWTRQEPIEDFVAVVLDHAGANLVQDRRTGLFRLVPIRGGYDVGSLPIFDESNILTLDRYERPDLEQAVNEVTVSYDDVNTGATGSITVHNLANITAQGGTVTQGRNYPGLPTADLAMRVALRDLKAVSTPLAKAQITVNREGYATLPGDVIRLSWPKLGLVGLVMRVLDVRYGTAGSGKVSMQLAQDVFGLPATAYTAQQATGWTDPQNAPQAVVSRLVDEATYWELVRQLGADAAAALDPDVGYVIAAAVRPSGDAFDYSMRTRTSTNPYVEHEIGRASCRERVSSPV